MLYMEKLAGFVQPLTTAKLTEVEQTGSLRSPLLKAGILPFTQMNIWHKLIVFAVFLISLTGEKIQSGSLGLNWIILNFKLLQMKKNPSLRPYISTAHH